MKVKLAVKMQLIPGNQEEYEKRHDELWPEMKEMLKAHGAKSYAIFLDRKTDELFGYLEVAEKEKWAQAAQTEINQKWWAYMADIMAVNQDNSPVTENLVQVFEL